MGTETLEIPVGTMTFTARAAGPADGRLVLLLHGFPETSHEWRHVMPALADAGYRAVAPDLRGYSPGARPAEVEAYQLTHLLADVLAIADWLGAHKFDLVGHDWGAALAWQLAGRYPERLRTLTIVSVPHPHAFRSAIADDPEQQQKSWYFEWFQAPEVPEHTLLADGAAGLRTIYGGLDDETIDEYVRVFTAPGALTAAINWYRQMHVRPAEPLGPITTPTLYVWSTSDVALGRKGAEATRDHVAGPYRFEVLEGVSHWIPEEAPGALNRMLLEHLAANG